MPNSGVLIIDDEPAVREALQEDLRREGFDLFFAENGKEGLSKIREVSPAVVILDLRMPVMDGLEFLAEIELKPSDPYTVIVLTGYGDDYILKACSDAGVTTFLNKPFDIFELRSVIKNAVAVQEFTNRLEELVKERTAALNQRVLEMKLVNDLVHRRVAERSAAAGQYRELLVEFQSLVNKMNQLAIRLNDLPPPQPWDFPGIIPGDET